MDSYIKIAIPVGDQLIQDVWNNSYVSNEKALFELFDAVEPNTKKKKKPESPEKRWQLGEIFRGVGKEGTNSPLYPDYAEMCAKVLWRAAIYPSNEMKKVHKETGAKLNELRWECICSALRAITMSFELRCVLNARYRIRLRPSEAKWKKAVIPQLEKIHKSFNGALTRARSSEAAILHSALRTHSGKMYADATIAQELRASLAYSVFRNRPDRFAKFTADQTVKELRIAQALLASLDNSVVDDSVHRFAKCKPDQIVKELRIARETAVEVADWMMRDFARMRFEGLL